jgi:hypothetical protein
MISLCGFVLVDFKTAKRDIVMSTVTSSLHHHHEMVVSNWHLVMGVHCAMFTEI